MVLTKQARQRSRRWRTQRQEAMNVLEVSNHAKLNAKQCAVEAREREQDAQSFLSNTRRLAERAAQDRQGMEELLKKLMKNCLNVGSWIIFTKFAQ